MKTAEGTLRVGDRISIPMEDPRWWVRSWRRLFRRAIPQVRREFRVTNVTPTEMTVEPRNG